MFKKTKIGAAAGLALGGALLAAGMPATAQQSTQTIEVTGSRIKRVDAEGALPVQVVTRQDIEKRGVTTINEVINNLTLVSQGSFAETQGAGNSFAPGTAGVSLRGLGSNATLVLLNGRRVANYGFAQNLDEAFVDLNSIPLAAVDRIEILKDGASALYGSDALAGVINVILRKDFRGAEAGANFGTTQDGGANERSFTLSAGTGDLAKDKFNAFVVMSYYSRDKLGGGDRDFSKDPDKTSVGGLDFRSPTGNPGTYLTAGRGSPAFTDNTVFSSCPASSRGTFSDGRSTCFYNFALDNWLLPKTERIGGFGRITYEVTPDLSAFLEVGLNFNVTNQSAAPTPGSTTLPVGHNSNPYPFAVPIRYRFTEVGPRLNQIDTDSTRMLVGLQGTHFGWSWDTGLVRSQSSSLNSGTNYVSASAVTAARPTYNYLNNAANSTAVVNSLRIATTRTGESDLKSFDFKASRDLFALGGGSAAVAVGVDYRQESLADTPDANIRAGNVVGSGGTSSAGDRSSRAVYAEFSLPFFKGFETQLAVRSDRYSDFGSATVPKVGVSYRPVQSLLFRGSVGEGFRAPSLVQLYQGASSSFPSIRDVIRCDAYTASTAATAAERTAACGAAQVRSVSQGNLALEAEKSKSFNLGVVFEPMRDLSAGIDVWRIEHTNKIDSLTSSYILRNADALSAAAGFPVVERFAPSARDIAVGAPGSLRGTGADTGVGYYNTYFNAQQQRVAGFDIDVRYRFKLADIGTAGIQSVITRMKTFKREVNPGAGLEELIDTWQYPKTRASTVFTLEQGSWNYSLVNNFVSSYSQFYQVGPQRVASRSTWDAQVQYSGFKGITLAAGGRNITNKEPPFADVDWYGFDSSNVDPRGAIWYVRANYKF
jgi:iron complex outermembrane recepter protein